MLHYCMLERSHIIVIQYIYAMNNYSWSSTSVATMLNSLDWPTLKSRLYSKLVMFYKVINGYIELPSISLFPTQTSTRGHSQHFRPPYASCSTYSFVPSTINLWKNHPENIVNQPSLSNFKESLYCIYVLQSGNYCTLHVCMILCVSVCYTLYRVLHSNK